MSCYVLSVDIGIKTEYAGSNVSAYSTFEIPLLEDFDYNLDSAYSLSLRNTLPARRV